MENIEAAPRTVSTEPHISPQQSDIDSLCTNAGFRGLANMGQTETLLGQFIQWQCLPYSPYLRRCEYLASGSRASVEDQDKALRRTDAVYGHGK